MTDTMPLHHRPALAVEQLGKPELYLAPDGGTGNRVLLCGWQLAVTAPNQVQQLWMDRTTGALLYVDNRGARWPEVYHAPTLDTLREQVEHGGINEDALARFLECAEHAIARWPYLAFDAAWLEYEVVTMADLYANPTPTPHA